jgi:hypothetical protein
MKKTVHIIPIFTTRGDVGGFLAYPYVYNRQGEWVGWVTPNRAVYSVHGHYVGTLSKDPRILRKQEAAYNRSRRKPPPTPPPIRAPAHVPLAPQMPELSQSTIDVFDESPELLPSVDFGDLRDDMD